MKFRLMTMAILIFLSMSIGLKAEETVSDSYTGSLYKGNYVWGGAMNLAWNELTGSIIKEPVKLATDDPITKTLLYKFNHPVFTKSDLDSNSYYIKSGFGQKTLDTINRECRQKFPSKSFEDLNLKLEDKDIISYAYFLKEVKYKDEFEKKNVKFNDKLVQGFTGDGSVYVLEYTDTDHFIASIQLKDESDQIFLAKGYPMNKPDEIVARLQKPYRGNPNFYDRYGTIMQDGDVFEAPMIHLDMTREYNDMIGSKLDNNRFLGYIIAAMQEKIKFDMDEKGARVENEAFIILNETAAPPNKNKIPRIMKLDKPYWIVMVRADSPNPYFILGVNNTEILSPVK